MRPLWRWTIGNVSEVGWEILSESVRLATKVYPEFDFVICHNNLTPEKENVLRKFSIPLLRQDDLVEPNRSSKNDFFWKLVPPRIRLDSYELWVDNDLVICDCIPQIDEWLSSNTAIVSSSPVGLKKWYGKFEDMIDPSIPECCAGLFGLPPYFNFGKKIAELSGGCLTGYDEQGLVVYVVVNFDHWISIPNHTVSMFGGWKVFFSSCSQSSKLGNPNTKFSDHFPQGIHFVRANRASDKYWAPWFFYKLRTMP